MSVIRVHKNKNFTVMSNTHLRDKNLSLKAKGLLSVMLSLPDNWDYSIAGLCAICKENETAVKSALNELKKSMYVIVERKDPTKENGGRIKYEYEVYEEPQIEKKQKEEKQHEEKQGTENLGVEFQGVDSVGQLNNNISSTDSLNTGLSKTDELNTDNNSFSEEKVNINSPNGNSNSFSSEKKMCRSQKQKKPLSEKELEQANAKMPYRAMGIAYRLTENKDLSDSVMKFFEYFLAERKKQTGTWHIPLSDTTLAKVIATITEDIKVDRGDYDDTYFPLIDETGNEDYKEVIDKYFKTKFQNKVDYSIVHFTQENVLVNIMNHCGKEDWCMSGI